MVLKNPIVINRSSFILDALAAYPDHWEQLEKQYPFFAHLRSKAFQKAAKELTLSQAAHMTGISEEDLIQYFQENPENLSLGHGINLDQHKQFIPKDYSQTLFDVRPFTSRGKDPFHQIRKKIKALGKKEYLTIVSDFRPLPLQQFLKTKGFSCSEKEENGVYFTSFYKTGSAAAGNVFLNVDESVFTELLAELPESEIIRLDVSDLPVPQPMEKILKTIDEIPEAKMLIVKHRKVPYLLAGPLKMRNWSLAAFERGGEFLVYIVSDVLRLEK